MVARGHWGNGKGKVRKIDVLKKVRENWSNFTRLEETFGVTVITTIFLLNKEVKFIENLSVYERVERAAASWGQKPLLELIFCIIWSGKFHFIREKSGNFEKWCLIWPCKWWAETQRSVWCLSPKPFIKQQNPTTFDRQNST